MPAFSANRGGLQAALFEGGGNGFDVPFIDIMPQGSAGCPTTPFRQSQAGARAQAFLQTNPVSGKAMWFKPAGQPILWSGDLTACRRVDRVARRARRVARKR